MSCKWKELMSVSISEINQAGDKPRYDPYKEGTMRRQKENHRNSRYQCAAIVTSRLIIIIAIDGSADRVAAPSSNPPDLPSLAHFATSSNYPANVQYIGSYQLRCSQEVLIATSSRRRHMSQLVLHSTK